MSFYRRFCGFTALFLIIILLAACGGSGAQKATAKPTPTLPPTPTPGAGQQLLATIARKFNTASTLHGVFDVNISGPVFNGTVCNQQWRSFPRVLSR